MSEQTARNRKAVLPGRSQRLLMESGHEGREVAWRQCFR